MPLRTSLAPQPHLYMGDMQGRPLDAGKVYFGEPNKDPELYPINVFYDVDLTIAAPQPIRTMGGFMNANGDMAEIYAAEYTYSVKVLDAYGRQVFYQPKMERINISEDTEISTSLPYPDVVIRTQKDKNADRVNIKDFGAVVGQDATVAIQNALNSGARDIEVSDGTYLASGNLYINNSNVRLYSTDNSTIDFSSKSSKANCISAEGTEGAEYAISTDVLINADSVTTDNTPVDVSAGDIVVLKSNEKDFANQEGFNGELLKVRSVVGKVVTFDHRVRRKYTATASIKLQKMNMLDNITIDGVNIIGTGFKHTVLGTKPADHGITMRLVKKAVVKNCGLDDVLRNSVRIDSCYGYSVTGNTINLRKEETTAQILYGICWLNYATMGVIGGNTINFGRHGVVHSEDVGYGTSYDTIVMNNTITGTYAAGLSTHSKVSNVLWQGNTVIRAANGIDLRNDGNVVTGNTFNGAGYTIGGNAIALRGQVKNTTISGNEFSNWRYAGSMIMSDDDKAPSNIKISNNSFNDCVYGLFFEHLGTLNSDGTTWNVTPATGIKMLNNAFVGGISQNIKLGGYFDSCDIRGNTHEYLGATKNYPIALQGAQNTVVSDITMTNSYGILESDFVVKSASGANITRLALNNIFRNLTAYQHDSGFKLLNSVASGKNAKILGDNINTARDIIRITGDSITAECPVIRIDTEGNAATDNLSTINALANDQRVTLRIADTARKITIKNAVGNIRTGTDIVLGNVNDVATLVFNDSVWRLESFRSNT